MVRNISLKTFRVDANSVDFKTGLPERLKLLNWGKNRLNTGEDVLVDEVSAKVFADNQRTMGRETVPIDYEHSTVPGTPAFERAKASDPVAGHGRPYVVEGEGLFIDQVATTPDGLKNAANFKDLSPAPLVEDGRVVAMHSLALTHAGAVEGLTLNDAAVRALSANCNLKAFSSDSIPNAYKNGADNNQGYNTMDLKPFRDADVKGEMKGMDDEAAMKFIIAKWCGLCGVQGPITPNNMNQTPTWDDSWSAKTTELISATVKPLHATIEALTAKLTEKEKNADESAKADVIAKAQGEGRPITLSADDIKGFSLAQLKTFVANVPKGVIPRSPLKGHVAGTQEIKTLSAAAPEQRVQILENNRQRTLDATIAAIRGAKTVGAN